jgi:uncharacterized protein
MSRENIEVVRRGYEAFMRGDVDGVMSSADPEIEIYPDPVGPLAGKVWRGREGILVFLEDWLEPWEEFRLEPREFIDVGDHVVLLADQFGRRKDSAFEVKMAVAHVYTLRGGSIVRLATYIDQMRALESVGQRE